jgi:hypothetical protein
LDWEKSPLGPISSWPQSKRTVDLMMASHLAMNLIWGPGRIQIYSDTNRAFLETKHPNALGRPGREDFSEVWEAAEAPAWRLQFRHSISARPDINSTIRFASSHSTPSNIGPSVAFHDPADRQMHVVPVQSTDWAPTTLNRHHRHKRPLVDGPSQMWPMGCRIAQLVKRQCGTNNLGNTTAIS